MLIRVALLLLLAISIDALKVEKVLKDIGKRYVSRVAHLSGFDYLHGPKDYRKRKFPFQSKSGIAVTSYAAWTELEAEAVLHKQRAYAFMFADALRDVASFESKKYGRALEFIQNNLMDGFKADICGQPTMNAYQYSKYLETNSRQHSYVFQRDNVTFKIAEDPNRDVLAFTTEFEVYDKLGTYTRLEYDVLLKVAFRNSLIFNILEIKQGGTCLNHGEINHSEGEAQGLDNLVDDVEGLEQMPKFKMFSKLFRPASYQMIDEDPNDLPRWWLSGINSSTNPTLTVCHEGVTEEVKYTEDEFRSWYRHFGIMWHTKYEASDEDSYELQLTQITKQRIIGRVTMNLQTGTSERNDVHKWEIKFIAENLEGFWFFRTIQVLCDASIEYKLQSLVHIREIISGKFLDELKYQNDTQWYSTPEFIRDFTKHGHVELADCVKDTVTKATQLDLFTKDKNDIHGHKFTMYWIEDQKIPSPAPDEFKFRMKTLSESLDPTNTEGEKVQQELEWTFDLKWDQKDQFYYIEKMGIGCAKTFMESVGETFSSIGDWLGR